VERLLFAGNNLDKARALFVAYGKRRPRARLTIRQRSRVVAEWPPWAPKRRGRQTGGLKDHEFGDYSHAEGWSGHSRPPNGRWSRTGDRVVEFLRLLQRGNWGGTDRRFTNY
jgi:hypothetical protein